MQAQINSTNANLVAEAAIRSLADLMLQGQIDTLSSSTVSLQTQIDNIDLAALSCCDNLQEQINVTNANLVAEEATKKPCRCKLTRPN